MKTSSASATYTSGYRDLSFQIGEESYTDKSGHKSVEQTPQTQATEAFLEAWALLQLYSDNLVNGEEDRINRKTLPERLAAILVSLSDKEGVLEGVHNQAIADCLGTYRENVGAILRAFRRQGLIQLGYRRIQILDMGSLQELASL